MSNTLRQQNKSQILLQHMVRNRLVFRSFFSFTMEKKKKQLLLEEIFWLSESNFIIPEIHQATQPHQPLDDFNVVSTLALNLLLLILLATSSSHELLLSHLVHNFVKNNLSYWFLVHIALRISKDKHCLLFAHDAHYTTSYLLLKIWL